jgi:hypothetical protein
MDKKVKVTGCGMGKVSTLKLTVYQLTHCIATHHFVLLLSKEKDGLSCSRGVGRSEFCFLANFGFLPPLDLDHAH